MTAVEVLRRPSTAWAALGLLVPVVLAVLVLPAAREPAAAGVPAVAALAVFGGVLLHRPAGSWLWVLVGVALVALGVLGAGGLDAVARVGAPSEDASTQGAAQVVVAASLVVISRWSAPRGGRTDVLEAVLVVSVLCLAVAQLAVLLASTSPMAGPALAASADLVLLAFVLRLALSRRDAQAPASWLAVGCAVLLVLHDVLRVSGAGQGPVSAALAGGFGLLGVALLHPSADRVLAAGELRRTRLRSGDVLGLLPLVAVPFGLRAVDLVVGGIGLPTWVHLLVGTVVAAAGVLRAWSALRVSEHLAEHDPLTDLPNRRGLARRHAEDAPAAGWALLLVDLDDFKEVNDAHGHDVGDLLLLGVRDRLLGSVGRDGVVARFGGDEFVVLVRAGREEALADRLLRDLRPPLLVRGLALRTSGSVGTAPADRSAGLSELLTRADVALYAAKGAGRDTVRTYHPEQRAEVQRRFTLTSQVRQLLGGRSASVGRLEVHYQPLVELVSGEVVGAEALVRWRHPEHGLLPPDAFLGHVTSSGLDAELDTAVLHEALEQMGRWRDQRRRSLPVSVNLTRTSLLDPALADRVREALARAGVPGDQLHVEITEHEPLPDDDRLLATLHALRGLGVEIHLDDYGTGYTSLDYLRRFPVRVLKVDRSVVAGVGAGGGQIVAGLGAMSRTLRLDLLAEGVETEEQRRRLVAQGVRLGQGWLFSHPLPAPVYAERVLGRPHECLPATGVPAPRLPLGASVDVVVGPAV